MNIEEKILVALGELKGDVRGMHREIKRVRRQLELQGTALQEQGLAIAALPCSARRQQISDLYKSVGAVKEDTGVIHIEEIKRKARKVQFAKFGIALLAIAGLAVATWQAINGG